MGSRMLAFDTSADVTAVAVLDGDEVTIEDSERTAERHAEMLLPRIEQCLARAGVALATSQRRWSDRWSGRRRFRFGQRSPTLTLRMAWCYCQPS